MATQRGLGTRKAHHDAVRAKIQTSALVTFVQAYALTGLDHTGKEVNPARIKAALGLLAKTLPDLQSVALTNGPEGAFRLELPWLEKLAKTRGWA